MKPTNIVTLQEYDEGRLTDGYIRCSTTIYASGYMKIVSVLSDWWIRAENGQSYSCTPDEKVYIFE